MTESVERAWLDTSAGVDAAWAHLDPVFVLGMQRSGTSIVAMALHFADCRGFAEGHLWHQLVATLDTILCPDHLPELRRPDFALAEERGEELARYFAVAISAFHDAHVPTIHTAYAPHRPRRWFDKTPGSDTIAMAPRLAALFPKSQFIFVHRDGAATVESGLRQWPGQRGLFQAMCQDWSRAMQIWRDVAPMLGDRALEVSQADLASNPDGVAKELSAFVGAPESAPAMSELFRSRRENSSFPERRPGDYRLEMNWTPAERGYFARVCGPEMVSWGYEVPFDSEGTTLYRLRRAAALLASGRWLSLGTEAIEFIRWQLSHLAAVSRKEVERSDL